MVACSTYPGFEATCSKTTTSPVTTTSPDTPVTTTSPDTPVFSVTVQSSAQGGAQLYATIAGVPGGVALLVVASTVIVVAIVACRRRHRKKRVYTKQDEYVTGEKEG